MVAFTSEMAHKRGELFFSLFLTPQTPRVRTRNAFSSVAFDNTTPNVHAVLMIGAGGIGCELLKTLVLTGFKDIEIVRRDERMFELPARRRVLLRPLLPFVADRYGHHRDEQPQPPVPLPPPPRRRVEGQGERAASCPACDKSPRAERTLPPCVIRTMTGPARPRLPSRWPASPSCASARTPRSPPTAPTSRRPSTTSPSSPSSPSSSTASTTSTRAATSTASASPRACPSWSPAPPATSARRASPRRPPLPPPFSPTQVVPSQRES